MVDAVTPLSVWGGDHRGTVYVELLFAIFPVFLVFFATCQVAMLSVAQLVVQHAATRAARTAIVVLEDDPVFYDGAPRGDLHAGNRYGGPDQARLFEAMGLGSAAQLRRRFVSNRDRAIAGAQPGARMLPIRLAAYTPLAILAPPIRIGDERVADTLSMSGLAGSIRYNQAASAVTIQAQPGADLRPHSVSNEPGSTVTVRVTYLYTCTVPAVRRLLCRSLRSIRGSRPGGWFSILRDVAGAGRNASQRHAADALAQAENPSGLDSFADPEARFALMTAEATLPNQGAAYTRVEEP